MEEIEVKIIDINKQEIIKKLLDLGAKKVFEGDISAVSYDFEDNYLTSRKSFVRLRKKGDKAFLTFKEKITQEQAKVMKEIESEVTDFDAINEILLALKLKPEKDHVKKRVSYQLGEVLFEIDEYENIPAYLEIEAPSIDLINEFVEKLGIDKDKVKSWTGKELLDHYGVKVGFMRI